MSIRKNENGNLMAVFRKADSSDAQIMAETRQKAWNAVYRGIYPDEMIDNYDLEFHAARDRKRISDPDTAVWLVMDGSSCVGYLCVGPCGFGRYKDFDFCLNSLYHLPGYQRAGLGRRAFELTCAECLRRGYDKFFCACNFHNHLARAFYEHMGGIIGKESTGHDNMAEDMIFYEFSLGDAKGA